MLVVPNLEGLLPMLLPSPEELEKERHGDEKNGWLKSFVYIYLYLRRKECVDCQEAHLALT